MKYVDHHMHTIFSGDCDVPLEEMIRVAKAKGQEAVMLTDHMDFDFPDLTVSFDVDFTAYNEALHAIRNKYPELDIRKGIEIGYQPHITKAISTLIQEESFDFIIQSLHVCERKDYMNGDFFEGKTQLESYNRYFQGVLDSIEDFQNFDVYGHLDFIVRYGRFKKKILNYSEHRIIIDKILMTLIKYDKGLELNTSGIRYGLDIFHPQLEILKRYYDLGGRIITVGSDAHFACHIQSDFYAAFITLRGLGFTEVADFKARHIRMINIEHILNTL